MLKLYKRFTTSVSGVATWVSKRTSDVRMPGSSAKIEAMIEEKMADSSIEPD